ncbi:MAG: ATP-binding protein [Nitrososphaerales archaeon]
MSHTHETSDRIVEINGNDIPEINLMDHLKPAESLLEKTAEYFFSSQRFSANAPFKGFLIHGPVGIGKTELVRQVARRVALNLKGKADVRLIPVDSSIVASPKWGESEQVFQSLFSYVKNIHHTANNPKVILLFDDIESLLLARGMSAAREWHYSLNAVFFHLVDSMNPFESMVFATTNRIDLMDAAVTTRLYSVELSNVPLKELLRYTSGMLESMLGPGTKKDVVLEVVGERLKALDKPTIRDCRQLAIISCIEKGVLSNN